MHEFALANSIREIVLETAIEHGAMRVREVRCRIGAMRQVVPSLMHTAFEACCVDTIAAGATLVMERDPLRVTCRACGASEAVMEMVFVCPRCESAEIGMDGGTDLTITSINIDQKEVG